MVSFLSKIFSKDKPEPGFDHFAEFRRVCENGGTVDEASRSLGFIHGELIRAAMAANNVPVMKYLINKFKDDQPMPPWRIDYLTIMVATEKLEYFKLFYDVDPLVGIWGCGHVANVPGLAVLGSDVPLLDFLLKKGINPDDAMTFGRPSMSHAVHSGKLEIVNMLLDHGATVKGSNALAIAQEADRFDVIKLLVDKGKMDINIAQHSNAYSYNPEDADEDGEIAANASPILHLAIEMGQTELVRALLRDLNADPMVKDGKDRTALERAQEKGNQKMIQLLTEKTG